MSIVIRECTSCGSTVETQTMAQAVSYAMGYDLSCCDGVMPNPCAGYPMANHETCPSGGFACEVARY